MKKIIDLNIKITKDITDKIVKELTTLAGHETVVGVPEGSGNEDNGQSIAYVASIHEFGWPSRGIPRRSFLIDTVTENSNKYSLLLGGYINNTLGSGSIMTGLNKLASEMQNDVLKKFDTNNWQPLKYREGSPLIDTGSLRQSIRGVVRKK